jgi:exonuclease III
LSNLKVTGDLNISADNINIQGSKVVANSFVIRLIQAAIIACLDVNVSQSTKHQGSNLKVTGDLNISANNINIQGSKVVANNYCLGVWCFAS